MELFRVSMVADVRGSAPLYGEEQWLTGDELGTEIDRVASR